MEEHELIELRSDEVQEILGTPPNWLIRWGTTIVVCLVIGMGILGYIVKYPDIIQAPIMITTSQPPTSVVARADANLAKLLVTEKQKVTTGDVLAIMQSTANYEAVMKADEIVTKLQQTDMATLGVVELDKSLLLGEIQTEYNNLIQAYDIYKFTLANRFDKVNVAQLQAQIKRLEKDYALIKEKIKVTRTEKLPIAEQYAAKQRTLFAQGAASRNDLENANARILEVKTEVSNLESSLLNKEVEIGTLKSRIIEIQQGANQGNTDKIIKVKEAITTLRAALDRWKQTFLLIAPIAGKVSFFNKYWKEQQFVKAGDEVLVIVPEEQQASQKIVGKLSLPVAGAGKVKVGQRVVVMLASYPYQEFGTVEGIVEGISLIPKDNTYAIQVAFNGDKLITNYHKEIPQAQQLAGDAQIVTEDKRFLQRIFDKIRGATHKY